MELCKILCLGKGPSHNQALVGNGQMRKKNKTVFLSKKREL